MGGGGKDGWEKLSDEEMAMLDKEARSEVKTLQRHLKSAISKGTLIKSIQSHCRCYLTVLISPSHFNSLSSSLESHPSSLN